jgi:hypothetical protein
METTHRLGVCAAPLPSGAVWSGDLQDRTVDLTDRTVYLTDRSVDLTDRTAVVPASIPPLFSSLFFEDPVFSLWQLSLWCTKSSFASHRISNNPGQEGDSERSWEEGVGTPQTSDAVRAW